MSVRAQPQRTLCLGEALLDLICERPTETLTDADAFVPHFGGVVANVAVVAARHGASVALAGGAGVDAWGRWLRDRLEREGVDTALFELMAGSATTVAMVAIDAEGEPSYEIHGETIGTVARALAGRMEAAVADSAALFISSNTLVGAHEREVTFAARELALSLERPVIYDPNLRLHRWPTAADAVAKAMTCVSGALLVRANAAEALLMTGEPTPASAAAALVRAGARVAVVTLGGEGALVRGEVEADVAGVPARVISTIGAGDTLTGILLARLAPAGFEPAAVIDALPEAVEQAARACERWGALE